MAAFMATSALATAVAALASARTPIPLDPYPPVHGGSTVGPRNPLSPDPLSNYHWDLASLDEPFHYQQYRDLPESVTTSDPGSFAGLEMLTANKSGSGSGSATVKAAGVFTVKFAQEGACWVEFESPDLAASGATVDISISENRLQGEVFRKTPVQHGSTYRVETNNQLYEGIRYAIVNVTDPGAKPWRITAFRRVCQVVPTNYAGNFGSSDPMMDRIWHTGAYTVKVTLVGIGLQSPKAFLGSELKDRGDRIAFLGDAHVAQATALVAFGNYELLNNSNFYTATIGNSIQPYWLMWVDSVLDYYQHVGDRQALTGLTPFIEERLDHGLVVATNNLDLRWSRDDDRMGFGFESPDMPEARRSFGALLIGASARYAVVAKELGNATAARKYAAMAAALTKQVRSSPGWFKQYGVHAAADAINAGIVTADEAKQMVEEGAFSDPAQLPSLSNFESYFVLKALAKINATDQALYLINRHWSGMLELGATTTWERYDPQWHDSGCLAVDDPPVNAMNDDTSMAHPWASGATAWLSQHGLGVQPTQAGFARWQAAPLLLALDGGTAGSRFVRWVNGSVPTPHGSIHFYIDVAQGACAVTVPAGTVASRIALPKLGLGFRSIRVVSSTDDGLVGTVFANESAPPLSTNAGAGARASASASASALSGGLAADAWAVSLTDVPCGRHTLAFEYMPNAGGPAGPRGRPPSKWSANNGTLAFAAKVIGTDNTTSGSWVGKYGASGHVLFNYTTPPQADAAANSNSTVGTDAAVLPAYVIGVYGNGAQARAGGPPYAALGRPGCGSPGRSYVCARAFVPGTVSDTRAPENPKGGALPRTAAAATSKAWASFHIEVAVKPGSGPFKVTLYMVDYNSEHIRQGIKVMDGDTLSVIAPMVVAEDFGRGMYVTYEYSKSMRFRFHELPSAKGNLNGFPPRPVVSGLFFD